MLAGQKRRAKTWQRTTPRPTCSSLPSLTETFGNVTTEAMASGLPVLAFDYAGAAQLITSGLNGRLAPYGDSAAFVRAAVRMARDRCLRHRFGQAARTRAVAQDWDAVVGRFEDTLIDALARGARPPPAFAPLPAAA